MPPKTLVHELKPELVVRRNKKSTVMLLRIEGLGLRLGWPVCAQHLRDTQEMINCLCNLIPTLYKGALLFWGA